ncbi:MAG: archaeosortase A [Methanotrichaceae archaeon]
MVLFLSMIAAWLISNILWISLILLLASALINISIIASLGWTTFGLFWLEQLYHYLSIEDYFNVILAVVAAIFCIYLASVILIKGKSQASSWAGYAAAICGIIYYPFAELEPLSFWLISHTTIITAELLQAFSIPVSIDGGNVLILNGRSVEIILACTAIESIALFTGVIVSVNAPIKRKVTALIASVLTIYILNLFRNAFVLMAYGWNWFGNDSFYVAHNIIAKFGSMIALLSVAYLVFMLLPELLTVIDELEMEIRHPGGAA